MRSSVAVLLVAALTAVVVGLLDRSGWAGYVVGAVLALSLWVMLFLGSYAGRPRGTVTPLAYLGAAFLAVAIGAAAVGLTDSAAFWSVGFIMAGAVVPATRAAARDRPGA